MPLSPNSPGKTRVRSLAFWGCGPMDHVARDDLTVLLLGETGTGEELVTHARHSLSQRREKLLVKLNVATFP